MAVMVCALFVSVFTNTMVNVAIPLIREEFGASEAQSGWVITGYALAFAVGIPLYGRVSDLFSLRRTFAFGLVVLAAGLPRPLAPNIGASSVPRGREEAGDRCVVGDRPKQRVLGGESGGAGNKLALLSGSQPLPYPEDERLDDHLAALGIGEGEGPLATDGHEVARAANHVAHRGLVV
ncbi:MAG: MFS transporter, partial [Rubrobacter sp.]|nr:MFS transporter [Rubrobacter sp.]